MNKIIFGQIIKELRESKNLTQKELANLVSKSENTITLIEQSKLEADFKTLLQLSKVFEVSIDYMLGLSEEKSAHLTIFPEVTELHLELLKEIEDFSNEDLSHVIRFINFIKNSSNN